MTSVMTMFALMAIIGADMDMQKVIDKASVLIEALPYIRKFSGSIVVVKYGGSAMSKESYRKSIIKDVALMKLIGMHPVLIHGGGNEITQTLSKMGKESVFIDGLRVTDEETAKITEMVLSGSIGKQLTREFSAIGIKAASISGKDGMMLKASKKKDSKGRDLGFVGEIEEVDTTLLETLIKNDFIPVVAPIGSDDEGNTYNINADYAATAVAGALKSQKLVFLTDVEGILRDKDDPTTIIRRLTVDEAKKDIKKGIITGGMIPKAQCCIDAIEKGVKSVHILDGRLPHSMLLEIFTKEGIGTMMTRSDYEAELKHHDPVLQVANMEVSS